MSIDEEVCRIFARSVPAFARPATPSAPSICSSAPPPCRHDLTLLTNNLKHFDRVEGLAIESA